jgi:hypothetical protein
MELGIQFFAADYPAALLASLAVIWRIAGWPSAIKEHWLLGNLASSDSSIRCIAVSMRRSEWPRIKISCVAESISVRESIRVASQKSKIGGNLSRFSQSGAPLSRVFAFALPTLRLRPAPRSRFVTRCYASVTDPNLHFV